MLRHQHWRGGHRDGDGRPRHVRGRLYLLDGWLLGVDLGRRRRDRSGGSAWTLSLRVSHLRRWTPSPSGTWGQSSTTNGSFGLIRGTPVAWRAWVQVGAGVPLDGAGRSAPLNGSLSTGFVKVF